MEADNSEKNLRQLREKNQALRLELEARGEQLGEVSFCGVCWIKFNWGCIRVIFMVKGIFY